MPSPGSIRTSRRPGSRDRQPLATSNCSASRVCTGHGASTCSSSTDDRRVPSTVVDVPAELKDPSGTLSTIEAVVDVPTLQREADELEQQASAPDLWNDTDNAQKVTSRLSFVQGEIRRVTDLRRR